MLHNLEREERAKIREASDKVVEPFRRVVAIAIQRVREGEVDSFNRQTVELSDDKNSRRYIITDVSVKESSGVVKSIGYLNSGLFIVALQLDKGLFSIQLPRDPDQVNKETLYWQRGSKPEIVEMLAVALSSARKL